ncbi:low affinity immunoglobulin gamma Fc region receptor III-B-like isoform X2 [Aquarana catesbeiana]|uniref:low affinity immunoglobulin gamma Fc region receptor III-B-like isoform X2 n=1 Tax=Aquarana catesbeiana TaxID=8400 RepID=UPI003CCA2827
MCPELSIILVLLIMGKKGYAVRPVVTFNPNWDKIFTTESLTMTCNVRSPIPADMSYTWYKDNNLIHTGQSFTIGHAAQHNGGNYQCKGSNTDRSDSVRLDVSSDWVILQAPLYIHEGDDVTLRCHHYPGYSGGRTIFTKDDTVIGNWGPDSVFLITNISIDRSGKYTCRKEVYGSRLESSEVSISVKESFTDPEIKMSANPIEEGDNITLTCLTKPSLFISATEVEFAFQRNGQNVQEFGSSSKYGILFAKLEDSGYYICEVRRSSNGLTKKSREINVQIEELFSHPEIVANPDFPREGNRVILTCNTSIFTLRNDIELQFVFYQNEKKVQKLNSSHQYIIPLAQLENSGNYSCEARALYKGMKKRSAVVSVVIQDYRGCQDHEC